MVPLYRKGEWSAGPVKPVHGKKHGKAARKSQTVDRSKHIGADVFSRIDDPRKNE